MAEFNSTCHTTLTSTVDSRFESINADSDDDADMQFIIVGKKCHNNQELKKAIEVFDDAEIIESNTGLEYINKAGDNTIFVLDNFEGDIYHRLNKECCRILGPSVIIQCAKDGKRLPNSQRPLYCLLMRKLVLCFTGYRHKEELARLAELVHHMGGSVRRDVTARVTHLVSRSTSGEKYRVAVSMGTPIMTEDWVYKCWDYRNDLSKYASDDMFMLENKMSPFLGLVLAFHGFSREEETDMEQIAQENGASIAEPGSPTCTHVIVEHQGVRSLDFDVHHRQHVVKSEWFWASVQMDACADESFYRFDYEQRMLSPDSPHNMLDSSTMAHSGNQMSLSGSKSRKRKRLRENLAQLASEGEIDTPMYKRRSSDMALTSCGTSFLDVTPDVSGHILHEQSMNKTPTSPNAQGVVSGTGVSGGQTKEVKLSARQLIIRELFSTEKNYVGILHTILKVFKEEVENRDQPGGPVLEAQDIKMIFGHIPPIYDVHMKIRDELNEVILRPEDDSCIGDIILKHADALMKCYPPFVNYFERTKETIRTCDKERPRFHALLMRAKSKPECGRQSLTELLIRPVQRLPSVMLLLRDILKKTEESNPDQTKLQQALEKLEIIMQHINEDKRKTEGHQHLFEIINDIENCPPDLLSSSRNFLGKADGLVVEGSIGSRGDNVTLFIFTDSLEICKRRVKVLNSKSPGQAVGAKTPQKAYKHVSVVTLSHIKRVVDVKETAECRHVFALITKSGHEDEKMIAFSLVDDQNKQAFLTMLCRTIATAICRANHESLKAVVEGHKLGLDTSDLGGKTLGKVATRIKDFHRRASMFVKSSTLPTNTSFLTNHDGNSRRASVTSRTSTISRESYARGSKHTKSVSNRSVVDRKRKSANQSEIKSKKNSTTTKEVKKSIGSSTVRALKRKSSLKRNKLPEKEVQAHTNNQNMTSVVQENVKILARLSDENPGFNPTEVDGLLRDIQTENQTNFDALSQSELISIDENTDLDMMNYSIGTNLSTIDNMSLQFDEENFVSARSFFDAPTNENQSLDGNLMLDNDNQVDQSIDFENASFISEFSFNTPTNCDQKNATRKSKAVAMGKIGLKKLKSAKNKAQDQLSVDVTAKAQNFSKRVSRAFSFNKTPRKLKRAISSMTQMSPFTRRDSTQSLFMMGASPSATNSNLLRNRLASVNDLTDDSYSLAMQENAYSELVDQISIGTPTPSKKYVNHDVISELDEVSMTSSLTPSIAGSLAPNHTLTHDQAEAKRKAEREAAIASQVYATPMTSRRRQSIIHPASSSKTNQ